MPYQVVVSVVETTEDGLPKSTIGRWAALEVDSAADAITLGQHVRRNTEKMTAHRLPHRMGARIPGHRSADAD